MEALQPFVGALMDAEMVEGISLGQNWAMTLIMQERFGEAEELLEKLLPLARKLAVDLGVAMITVLLANLRWRQGRWREAYSHSTLYALSPDLPSISSAWGSAAAASMAAALGKVEATHELAQRAFDNIPNNEVPMVRAWAHAALGHLHLSQGQPAIALAHLRKTAACVAEMELGQPLFFLWWGDFLEALIEVGEREEAEEILTQLEQGNELLDLRWTEGICQRIRGSLAPSAKEARVHFAQSIVALSTCPYRFEIARTKLQWARYLLQNGHANTPINGLAAIVSAVKDLPILHEAHAEFQRLDATLWKAAAQSLVDGSAFVASPVAPAVNVSTAPNVNLQPSPLPNLPSTLDTDRTTNPAAGFATGSLTGITANLDANLTLAREETEAETEAETTERNLLLEQRLEDVLSEAELRVALVVAAGRSNREVALDLYISVRTVEFHLSAIFRKLGLKNRNALIKLIQKG
jgi:DNA-binding CsgD family transcriptional regulator